MKIQEKFKQIAKTLLIGTLCITNLIPTPVFAATYRTSSIHHGNWWVAYPYSGRSNTNEGQLQVNGEDVFCIDAYTDVKLGINMNLGDWKDVGISEELAKELSLISYFGTKVPGRTSGDWYAITQGLIWKVRHVGNGDDDLCYVQNPTAPDYANTVK